MGSSDIKTCLEIDEAVRLFCEAVQIESDRPVYEVNILDAEGLILAEDIISEQAVPSFPKSAMDGYAVKAQDTMGAQEETPVHLKVLGENLAGDFNEIEYQPGSAVRVMTGAYVPTGYNAVIKQEDTDYGMDTVAVFKGVGEYMNYCRIGEDIAAGECVVRAGTYLTPAHIGILASVGKSHVFVQKPLRVSIISTGSEIQAPGEALRRGAIYNNSAYMLAAAIKRAGLKVSNIAVIPDYETVLADAVKGAVKSADIIITTGAVSVGKRDIIPQVLSDIGADIIFSRANIQPGTPTVGSVYKNIPILSLSGNPFAAYANFEIYFWELAAYLSGCDDLRADVGEALLLDEYKKVNVHRRLVRAFAHNGEVTLGKGANASSVISNMTECNCFIDIPAQAEIHKGDKVKIRWFKY